MQKDVFAKRHIGISSSDQTKMLKSIGVASMDELINKTIPGNILLKNELNLPKGMSEFDYLNEIKKVGEKNKIFKSYIGLGYYDCIVPSPIKRNILENPGWYTAYTPYQSEISQGRLEALLNFQTMVSDLTGLEIANGSLLDEATAAAEGMIMLYNTRSREQKKADSRDFLVSNTCYTQTIEVLKTRAIPLGINLIFVENNKFDFNQNTFGCLIQYPEANGEISNYSSITKAAKELSIGVVVATDLLSLTLLSAPGDWGADIVVGNSQRFGVPMGYGGPHAAFFATHEKYKRNIPGRIIGVSQDAQGNRALRMALQTREQHIRRDKATSNICTAQALLAIMAGMYAVYHGPDGIRRIGNNVYQNTRILASNLANLGLTIENKNFFDSLTISIDPSLIKTVAEAKEINFRYTNHSVGLSINETTSVSDIEEIVAVFAEATNQSVDFISEATIDGIPSSNQRTSDFLTHPVFNEYHSESELMRYIKRLENKDISLTHSMISLGSCTMKLNAASELFPISFPEFGNIHPFAPLNQAMGYTEVINDLEKWLCEVTGFYAMSFQPNSGAQGEYAGLMVIREYHNQRGDFNRNIALIPSSAHGTNPASAVMAGMKVVVVKCDDKGNIDVTDLKEKSELHKSELSCLMITYPSTHGVYEASIIEITDIIHANGGQVYMDGANMNAQVGLTNPALIGADVCHLNLHKTFAIPHGGGGPGVGPIGVAEHLAPYLPGHSLIQAGGEKGITAVSAAPFGSALILLISYGYCKMLGSDGLTSSTEHAILNGNYLRANLENDFPILYRGTKGMVAHEMILDCRDFKKNTGIEVEDIAKRLIDYGFHAPTVSFPVAGTLMIEPTESESKNELDRFIDVMKSIRKEIAEVEEGLFPKDQNVLKNAPHTAKSLLTDNWDLPYSRIKAAYPLQWLKDSKYWVPVARVDNAFGDRNLICTCPPIADYVVTD